MLTKTSQCRYSKMVDPFARPFTQPMASLYVQRKPKKYRVSFNNMVNATGVIHRKDGNCQWIRTNVDWEKLYEN